MLTPTTKSTMQNHLLAALPTAELDKLLTHMELVPLKLGTMLYEPGEQMRYAYFPTTAIISLHYVTESGSSVETAGVGNEGMVGVSLFMGGNTTPSSALVQTAGYAYRLERHSLSTEFKHAGLFQHMMLHYSQALLTHLSQTSTCNRHHSIEQQLPRWLLCTLDPIPSGELIMTQELVTNMLGVRRESVTTAAGNLQQAGCINYRRGHISILNRKVLESRVCECYLVVKKEVDRLMGPAGR